jgi:hypothetical protein
MDDIRKIDAENRGEKFLDGQMKVMHETGIVNDTGIVYIAEADLDRSSKSHAVFPPLNPLDQSWLFISRNRKRLCNVGDNSG